VFKNICRIFLLHERADKCVKYLTEKLKWEIKQKIFEIFYLRESRVGHFFDKLLTAIVINNSRQLIMTTIIE